MPVRDATWGPEKEEACHARTILSSTSRQSSTGSVILRLVARQWRNSGISGCMSQMPGPSLVLPSSVRDQSRVHPTTAPTAASLEHRNLEILAAFLPIGAQSSRKTLDVQSGSALTKFEDLPPTTRQLAPAFTQCPASHLGAKKQVILSDKRGSVRDLKLTDMRLSHCHGYALWPGSERHPRLKLTSSVAVLRGHEVAACSYAFRVPGTCTSYVVCEYVNP